ncbi:MAG: lysophospholipid acyltransferase family protein [Verrucomicrobiota bacterium]|nr:lysophospholipid acyltransferase family protein [Verrucomicrobiota bacterium]
MPFYLQPVLLTVWTVFFFFFAAPARRAILSNLAVVLPGSSAVANYFRAFRTLLNFAWTITDGANYKLTKAEFTYDIEGAEFLDQLGAAKGAIVLTAHMGNYDLGAALFAQKFQRQIRMVRAPEPDAESASHLSHSVEQTGEGAVKIAYNSEGALLSFDLLNALREGEIVSIQGDRVIEGVASADGRLFDVPVRIPSGPFSLAQVAQVPIFPLFIVRRGHHRYGILAHAPIMVARSARSREEDIGVAVARWCDVLQETIGAHWDQWFSLVPIFAAHEQR